MSSPPVNTKSSCSHGQKHDTPNSEPETEHQTEGESLLNNFHLLVIFLRHKGWSWPKRHLKCDTKKKFSKQRHTHTPENNLPVRAHCVCRPLAGWKAVQTQRRPETDWSQRNWVAGESVGGRWWWAPRRLLVHPLPPHDALCVVLTSEGEDGGVGWRRLYSQNKLIAGFMMLWCS